jgi:hypothetical protein
MALQTKWLAAALAVAMEADGNLHEAMKGSLPEDWPTGSYQVIRIPEGLPQTLTLRLPKGAVPSPPLDLR